VEDKALAEQPRKREPVGLPPRPFLYTLDQIGQIISVDLSELRLRYLHFENRTVGGRRPERILARNIAEPSAKPDWRVSEQELIRWLRHKGFKYYERGWVDR
jgi:hypothetical protein